MQVVKLLGAAAVTFLAACGDRPAYDVKPLSPRARQADELIDVSSITATVRRAKGLRPPCPVYPHTEARMVVRGVAGTVQYRWERSDGTAGPLTQFMIQPSTTSATSVVTLRPDDWKDEQRAIQLTIDDHVHVSYPFDFHSAPVTLNIKCY